MHNPFSNSLHIELSSNGIVLRRVKGLFRKKTELIDKADAENVSLVRSQIGHSLQARLASLNISRVNAEVIIPDEWVRYFTVTPPRNAQSLRDCRIAAEMRFRSLYEDNLTEWTLKADWSAQNDFIACAIPNSLLDTFKEVSMHRSLSLYSVRPQFIAACNRWRKRLQRNDWFCVMSGDTLSVGIFVENKLTAIRVSTIPSEVYRSSYWFLEHIARESLRLNVQMPSEVRLYTHRSAHWIADSKDPIRVQKMETDFYRVRFRQKQ